MIKRVKDVEMFVVKNNLGTRIGFFGDFNMRDLEGSFLYPITLATYHDDEEDITYYQHGNSLFTYHQLREKYEL